MLILFFLLFLDTVYCTPTMMLVYGTPETYTNGNLDFTLSWDKCVQSCFNTTTCVMAWQVQSDCVKYDYSNMGTVTKTDSKNGSIVAFKVDTPSGTCPVGSNPPTFGNQNATGSMYIASGTYPKWVYYTIYSSGDTWGLTFTVNNSCTALVPYYFKRSDGTGLCYLVYMSTVNITTLGYSYTSAVASCKAKSSNLTSFWSTGDATYFKNLKSSYTPGLFTLTGVNNTYVRVDGIRTPECQLTPTTEECMSVKGFTFTGPAPSSFDYYSWVTNSSAQETPDDNCIVMVWNSTNPVKMDIRTCSVDGSPLPTKTLICSNPAWVDNNFYV